MLYEDWRQEQAQKAQKQRIQDGRWETDAIRITKQIPPKEIGPAGDVGRVQTREEQGQILSGNRVPETMEAYDKSGQLDRDLSEQKHEQLKEDYFQAIGDLCKLYANETLCLKPELDGEDIFITVTSRKVNQLVGKWRFVPPLGDEPIQLYHFNYRHSKVPGPAFHLQTEAKQLYDPLQILQYIQIHDRKRENDLYRQQKEQGSDIDDLIAD
jgi:hypothetical protein